MSENWIQAVAADIASRVSAMHQDCVVNNEALIRGLIEEAVGSGLGKQVNASGGHVDAIDRVDVELEQEQSRPA